MNQPALVNDLMIFAGNATSRLADDISTYLKRPLGAAMIKTFSDGETRVEIGENVRGQDVFVVQSTCPPVNDSLMELLLMLDALKRASAKRITAVIPYYGYSRQDRKVKPRVPISGKLVADLLTVAGAQRIITTDLHSGQIQGFFNIPVDNLFAAPVFVQDIRDRFVGKDLVIVSPDAGGVERARAYAKRLMSDLAIIYKRRTDANKAELINVIGDVKDKVAIILDDMADTAGTLKLAANALKSRGALEVHGYVTHPVLSGPAINNIMDSPISSFVVTDTIPLSQPARDCGKIRAITIAPLVGEAIIRSHNGLSVSGLFD
ncbi:MAG: ribose-phosphate pyrophosphokinase [Deltaproteobacteria bacterium]|nr:ribose-phosphate pyrophosphokinase [Deltaproteobacteria bacterium]